MNSVLNRIRIRKGKKSCWEHNPHFKYDLTSKVFNDVTILDERSLLLYFQTSKFNIFRQTFVNIVKRTITSSENGDGVDYLRQ